MDVSQDVELMLEEILSNNCQFKKWSDIEYGILGTFYTPFLILAQKLLKKAETNKWSQKLEKSFYQVIYNDIEKIGIRTLILEMNIYKTTKGLKGKNSTMEYNYYINEVLNDSQYIKKILYKYPVLKKCLIRKVYYDSVYLIDIYTKYHLEYEKLSKLFHFSKNVQLESFIDSNGDAHINGRKVYILELSNKKKLVYKPRDVSVEVIFYNILNYIEGSFNIKKSSLKILDCGDHGWSEYIRSENCNYFSEVRLYYRRIGIILFIAYILGVRDLHYENLIISGESPFFIDTENSLVYSQKVDILNSAEEEAKKFLSNSVLNIGILPLTRERMNGIKVDFSVLGQVEEQILPIKVPYIVNVGTSDMKIAYTTKKIIKPTCVPDVNGQYLPLDVGYSELLKGFRDSYHLFMENNAIWRRVFEELNNEVKSRYLINDTYIYSSLLNSSYHPKLMVDEKERTEFLERVLIKNRYQNDSLRIMEISSLENCEIPYFYCISYKKSLFDLNGNEVKDYFSYTPIELLTFKLKKLSVYDFRIQNNFITAALGLNNLTLYTKNVTYNMLRNSRVHYKNINETLYKIAKIITERAVFNASRDEVTWFIKKPSKTSKVIEPCDLYIYNGLAGFAIFYYSLTYSQLKKDEYKNMCELIKKQLFRYTEEFIRELPHNRTGIMNGEASIVYCYQILFKITKKVQFIEYAKKHMNGVLQIAKYDMQNDWLAGNAGVIVVLVNMYAITKNERYINAIQELIYNMVRKGIHLCGGIGWKSVENLPPLTGVAHGNSGVIMALTKALEVFPEKNSLIKLIKDALVYENYNYNKKFNNWRDLRTNTVNDNGDRIGWCNGAAGVLLSRLEILRLKIPEISDIANKDVNKAYEKIKTSKIGDDLCLCHGIMGINLILDECDKTKLKSYKLVEIIQHHLQNEYETEYNMGFMTGLSGAGYALLSFINEENPNVLKGEI